MHFYWRIIEELSLIGETWIINDPSLKRNFEKWLEINAESIALGKMDRPTGRSAMVCRGTANTFSTDLSLFGALNAHNITDYTR